MIAEPDAAATRIPSRPDPSVVLPESSHDTVICQFLEWVRRTPGQVAIRSDDECFTYAQLAAAAESLAQSLVAAGIRPGDAVAVAGQRSIGLIAAILGVLQVRGVLLTLDATLPQERIESMMDQSDVRCVVLAAAPDGDNVTIRGRRVIRIEPDTGRNPELSKTHGATIMDTDGPAPDDAAYIFFTSGTTGVPKGVLGAHKGLAHFVDWQRNEFTVSSNDRVAQLTGLSFDPVLRDVFLPLTSGATLCLPRREDLLGPIQTLLWLDREMVTVLHTVPSLARQWLTDVRGISLDKLRWTFFAGEPLTDSLVRRWRESFSRSGAIVNFYGPTETTLAKCHFVVPDEPPAGVQPIGRPMPGTQVLVLDANRQMCASGETGQLVIRTPFRTLGYINAAEEQTRRFVRNPFRDDESDLLYFTGDLGRYAEDGTLEILGRSDNQVKIRGMRVELEEIDSALTRHTGVLQAAVVARPDPSGDKRLEAFFTGNGTAPSSAELREFLQRQIPDYMIPSSFWLIGEMPLTPSGKTDRRALMEAKSTGLQVQRPYEPPRTETERRLTELWSEILAVDRVGVLDDYFELGGTSLDLMMLGPRILEEYGVEVALPDLFQKPTIEGLAGLIEDVRRYREDHLQSACMLMNTLREDHVFAFPPILGYGMVYKRLAQPIKARSFYAFDFIESDDPLAGFADRICELQPDGPLVLFGYSAGGKIAFETTKLLAERGRHVAHLILLDASFTKHDVMEDDEIEAVIEANLKTLAPVFQEQEDFRIFLRSEFVRKQMVKKMRALLRYENTQSLTGCLHADIHYVRSGDLRDFEPWGRATTGKLKSYHGAGRHIEMAYEGNAEKNGEVVNRILWNLENSANESNEVELHASN